MQITKDLAAIGRYLRRCRHRYMAAYGLKSIHARLLIEVCENPGISQDCLSQRVGFDKSNITRQACFLEEQGFLERKQGQDKRVLALYPTEKTAQLLPGLQSAMEEWEQSLLRALTDREQETLQALLTKLRTVAEQGDRDGKAE